MRFSRSITAALVSFLLAVPAPLPAQKQRPRTGQPTLVVILVVDQMRTDYIDRYGHMWTKGLRRLIDGGAWFRLGAYPYWNTITCAGHATIGTGTYPATHGMVLNAWWDRASGKQVSCTDDDSVANVTAAGPASPGDTANRLLVPTLADEMRVQLPVPARVVSLSFKERSAIGLAGHRGDVVWYSGGWRTSAVYSQGLPPFLQTAASRFNLEEERKKAWVRLLPESAYLFSDDDPAERPPRGETRIFPHNTSTPASDVALAEVAKAAVDDLRLGQGPGADFLGIGFSALDSVGHDYGPHSHEVQDTLVRLDATIGSLLDHLDRKVGVGNYVVALSADHGVAPIPEQMQAAGLEAGRVTTGQITQAVEKALEPHLGPGPHVARYSYTDLYFKPGVYAKLRENAAALRAVEEAILALPGIWRVYRGEDLVEQRGSADPATRAAALSYFPGRSGDVIVLARPYWFASTGGTTHGSGHAYDQRVPIVLMGHGVRPGEYLTPATPADIAPTLAYLMGITLSRAEGRVLSEALTPRPAPARPAKNKP